MMYSVKKRENPINREESKFYATAEYSDEINIRQLACEISKGCTLNPADIVAVIESFLDKVPHYLKNSNKVRLDNFGILKLSFRAKGQQVEKDVTSNDITNVRVLFQPSTKLKQELADITYTKK
ncbi:HU family DNA-binding protein [Treponema sp. UBA6852]|uniref:HU family DNA-binding protein n=2 Tax=unclassified Treponema TaxID=2638727 RepID=UPI000E9E8308|nr:HU family DNA-binding protein [Treponema sp. UBA6852]HBP09244.1 DNA-binding protein [Treponema sp.]